MFRKAYAKFLFFLTFGLLPAISFAANNTGVRGGIGGGGMPWEGPLQKILDSLSGPTAKILATAAVIITGLMMAFGEHGQGARKVLGIAFGCAIVFFAGTFLQNLGFSGALR
jgi:type IV secretion system protein VirB2